MAAINFSAVIYRDAAIEHADTAKRMYELQHYVMAHYTAGLSVEAMLRAYRWRLDQTIDTRHDLRQLLKTSQFDRVIPQTELGKFSADFSTVQQQWDNVQRFYSNAALRKDLKDRELDRNIQGDFVKERCRRIVNAASEIVTLGSLRWSI